MYSCLAYITWDVNPEIFSIGNISIRYYSLFFYIGVMLAWVVIFWIYSKEKIPSDLFFKLSFYYLFGGLLFGPRLVHCLFYEPAYYFAHPQEIFLPFSIINGKFLWTGYRGLASHGAVIGFIIGIILYCWRTGIGIFKVLDITAMAAPFAASWIRLGNLMNSEIIGKPADLPWSFIFTRIDYVPRHPAQLYEAIAYMALFIVIMWHYIKHGKHIHKGFYLGLCIFGVFTFRFFVEFLKENQISAENTMVLNIGQWLSIPFIIAGLFLCLYTKLPKKNLLKNRQVKY